MARRYASLLAWIMPSAVRQDLLIRNALRRVLVTSVVEWPATLPRNVFRPVLNMWIVGIFVIVTNNVGQEVGR
jgi:hypothetical protein